VIGERGPGWGIDWGTPGEIPATARCAASDAEAAKIFAEFRRSGQPASPVVLTGGDLARTLGVEAPLHPEPLAGRAGVKMHVDVGAALVDGRLHWFVAHLVARKSWWRGRLLLAANASFLGSWNAAPRSHPGDGRLDVFDTNPPLRVRLAARQRLLSGSHVPHPRITQRRVTASQHDLNPGLDIRLDGVKIGRARSLSLRVEPGALEVWIPSDVGSQS